MKTNEIDELRTFFNNIADNGKIEEVELMKAIKTPKRAEKLCEVLKITVRDPQCQVITNFFTRAEEEEDEDLNQDLNQDGGIDFNEFMQRVLYAKDRIAKDAEKELEQLCAVTLIFIGVRHLDRNQQAQP